MPVCDTKSPTSLGSNCGGQDYTDFAGVLYQSDKCFSGGFMNSTTSSISGTMDGIVYQNWGYRNFPFHLPLVNGNYSVTRKSADWDSAARQSVFDVGMLDIDFVSNIDTTKINAILVKPIDPEMYTISASAGTGGSITPSGTTSILSGGSKSFTITPNAGSVIADVTVDGVSIGPLSSYTFSKVSSNHTIQASFASSLIKTIFAVNCGGTSYTDSTGHAYLADTICSGEKEPPPAS
ncbi:MAG TPA: malectin domain-containing carbohydrate-binding protein [Desulfuromonadaceae bacterium]